MRFSVVALTTASLVASASAATVELWWNISYAMNTNPDGLYPRRAIGINGTWPPPIVQANQGDQVIIHAYNGLDDGIGTALHSHGIYFNGSSYFDGSAMVTQCPIPPGETLTYEIPTDLQSGTYWIHGHYIGQYTDGLRTPFIIHPPQEVQKYDEDYLIAMGDWYHDEQSVLLGQYMNIFNPTGAEPVPKSAIAYIANNGTYVNSLEQIGQGVGVSSGDNKNAILNFEPGKTYRLRIINMAAFAMFRFSIDGHNMSVIEIDGADVEPYQISSIPISAAQRYSVLITARNDTSSNWPITMAMDPVMFDVVPADLVLNITAQIVYASGATLQPGTVWEEYPTFWDTVFTPVEPQAMAPADTSLEANVWFAAYDDGMNHGTFNNITYVAPLVPTIFSELSMGQGAYQSDIYGAQTNAIVLNHMDNIQLKVYNWHIDNHPFHLHGHKFQVVNMAIDETSTDPTLNPPLVEGQSNPLRRDTIMVPAGGSVTLRFRADNPGTWFFHCHIEWHLEAGLAMVFVEAPTQAQQLLKPPQAMYDHCAMQNIPYTGNVVGLNSTTDFAGQPWGPFPQDHIIGWTTKAIGAMAGSILSCIAGVICVVWYSMHAFKDEEREHLAKEHYEEKRKKGGKAGLVKRMVRRNQAAS